MSCSCKPETAADEAGTEEAQPGPVRRLCALCKPCVSGAKVGGTRRLARCPPAGEPQPGRDPGVVEPPTVRTMTSTYLRLELRGKRSEFRKINPSHVEPECDKHA